MRRRFALVALLTTALILCGCGTHDAGTTTNATNANSTANSNGAAGAHEGAGPHNVGIGGTGESNANRGVAGNSNVEPTGVNKNVGSTPRPSNSNR